MNTNNKSGMEKDEGEPDLSSRFLEHSPLPMVVVAGPSHVVRYTNPAFCSLLGIPQEELLGKSINQILPDEVDCGSLLDRVYRTKRAESHTGQQNSTPRPVFWSYTIWPVSVDQPLVGIILQVTESVEVHENTLAVNQALILGSLRQHELTAAADASNEHLQSEIAERKRAHEALLQAQAQLSRYASNLEDMVTQRTVKLTATNQQLEAFVYSIAHDLRAPLRAMQGYSSMLAEDEGTVLSPIGVGFTNRINKAAQHMDALLSDLLAFSRVSQQDVVLTAVNLQEIVSLVVDRLKSEIAALHATIETEGIWPHVMAHEPTLAQVIFNLVSNALKFVVPDRRPVVKFRVDDRGDSIRLWIEDNGVGIAVSYQEQIFRLFTRLNGDKFPGTGIGLAIVQKGVERLGGRIGLESVEGQGSQFWIELKKA